MDWTERGAMLKGMHKLQKESAFTVYRELSILL